MRIVLGESTIPVAFVPERPRLFVRPTITKSEHEELRALIVCCDGAQNGTDYPTNVEKFRAGLAVRSQSNRPQLTFYDKRGAVAICVGMISALSSGINLSDHAARSMI